MESPSFLLEALRLAEAAALRDEVPVGAVIVHEGKVIGEGSNTREEMQDPLGHAEMIAIKNAALHLQSWRLIDCDLYVTLEPCPMCLAACQQARVRRVIYGAKDEKGGALCLGFHVHEHPQLNHRFQVIYEPMEACSQILRDFFAARREAQKAARALKGEQS